MNREIVHRTRASMATRTAAIVAFVALGLTACSTDDPPNADPSSSVAPDEGKANAALDAGLKAHAAGDLTGAAASYRETLKYDPKNQYAFYNLALIDAAAGNYGLAEEKYRAALETDPRYEPALFNLAILRTSRDPEEAIALYRRAVEANDESAASWLNLGLLLRADGQKKEGNRSVLKALALDPALKDPAQP